MGLKDIELSELVTDPADDDIFTLRDVSDLADGANGTSKFVKKSTIRIKWGNLDSVPSTFAPSAHTHVKADVTDHNEGDYLHTAGTESAAGVKTFSDGIVVSKRLDRGAVTTVVHNAGATLELDLDPGNHYEITLETDMELDVQTANPTIGVGEYTFILVQDGVGGHALTFASGQFIAQGGSAPTFNTAANNKGIMTCFFDGSKMIVLGLRDQLGAI